MEDSVGRHPTACLTCAKAKVRCSPEANGPCQRCRRLGKECGNQLPGAHRRTKQSKTSSSDVAVLEAKLDRMVAMLAASEQTARERVEAASTPSSYSAREDRAASPSDVDDQLFVEVFINRMLPLFPFLVIPAHITVEDLRRDKPFLCMNISMIACPNASRQREIADSIQEYVAKHIIIKGEQNLDLLQGLLLNVTWFTTVSRFPRNAACCENNPDGLKFELDARHVMRNTSQIDNFVHLLVAQSVGLGLNQEPASQRPLNYPLAYIKDTIQGDNHNPIRTLEERRTYLGCFYMTTMLSACAKDLGTIIRFTKYTEDCCNVLEQASEYPSDAYLVQLVRIMNLAEKIQNTLYRTEFHLSSAPSTPLGLSIRWLEAELKQLRARMPSEELYSTIISFHCNTLEIHLYRIALSPNQSDSHYGDYPLARLDLLYRTLEATSSFFKSVFSVPASFFPYLPFTIMSQFGKAMITLSQLSLFDHPGWDRTYVESTVDFNQMVNAIGEKLKASRSFFEEVLAKKSGSTELPEIFERMSLRGRMMKSMHQKRKDTLEQTTPPEIMNPIDFNFMLDAPFDILFPFGEMPVYTQID
ncbi:uncharacterized protein N7511_001887 [Penicillium nucicola]|uniref:uncharacterized protein n=1 Tax=Penicillium nucicola TaxID=1850975 RepID=UPI002545B26E|nr:uncharacterized protein N7511_001887 [Penicillium nucicola]KAJ5769836.1 hypothetical protein N7511_001887 [Penicillium nucicola]